MYYLEFLTKFENFIKDLYFLYFYYLFTLFFTFLLVTFILQFFFTSILPHSKIFVKISNLYIIYFYNPLLKPIFNAFFLFFRNLSQNYAVVRLFQKPYIFVLFLFYTAVYYIKILYFFFLSLVVTILKIVKNNSYFFNHNFTSLWFFFFTSIFTVTLIYNIEDIVFKFVLSEDFNNPYSWTSQLWYINVEKYIIFTLIYAIFHIYLVNRYIYTFRQILLFLFIFFSCIPSIDVAFDFTFSSLFFILPVILINTDQKFLSYNFTRFWNFSVFFFFKNYNLIIKLLFRFYTFFNNMSNKIKWQPLFKKTSYYGLYQSSKNRWPFK